MQEKAIEQRLISFVSSEFLGNDAPDLATDTPLLDLGVLDSFSILKLLAFADRELGVRVPLEEVSVDDMKDISSIAAFLSRRSGASHVSHGV